MKDTLVYQPSHRNESVPVIGVTRDANSMSEEERLLAIKEMDDRLVEDKWETAHIATTCFTRGEWTHGLNTRRPTLPHFTNYMNARTGRDRAQSEWTTLIDVYRKISTLGDPTLPDFIKANFVSWSKINVCLPWMSTDNANQILRMCKETKDGGLKQEDLRRTCIELFTPPGEFKPYVDPPDRRSSLFMGYLRDHRTGFLDENMFVLRRERGPLPTEAAMWLLTLEYMEHDEVKSRDQVMIDLFRLLAKDRPELVAKAQTAWKTWLKQKAIDETAWPL